MLFLKELQPLRGVVDRPHGRPLKAVQPHSRDELVDRVLGRGRLPPGTQRHVPRQPHVLHGADGPQQVARHEVARVAAVFEGLDPGLRDEHRRVVRVRGAPGGLRASSAGRTTLCCGRPKNKTKINNKS